ncbi:hypothetical protein V2G26_018458 [Clonostachys chloroleuca]
MAPTAPSNLTGHRGNSARSIMIALAISLAGFVNGIDTGIISSTIAQKTFKLYMYGPAMDNVALKGGIVSGYYAGYALGSTGAAWSMDRLSRRWTLFIGSIFSVVGAVLQTAAMNPAMMIVGRAISGFSIGMVYPTAPVYLAELSPPENRGFLVGLKGLLNTLGFCFANWIGYAGSYAKGDVQWRVPLGCQIPPALLLGVLTLFLPYSPRWLAMKERHDEAKKVMYYLQSHRGEEAIEREFSEMCQQIQLEAQRKKMANFTTLFTRKYIRRTLLVCLTVQMMKLSGSNIIQTYQSIMYEQLGYKGQTVLLLGGFYGFMAVIGQILNVFLVADRWTRRGTVIPGSMVLATFLAVLTGLSASTTDSTPAMSRAGIAFVFLFAFGYSFYFNSVNWVLVAEIFPLDLRGVGVGFSIFTQSITAIWLNYAASYAFDAIAWKFYFVFIACNLFAGTMYYFFLPETRFLSLEEIAAKFGDEVAPVIEKHLEMDDAKAESREAAEAEIDKSGTSSNHVEVSKP